MSFAWVDGGNHAAERKVFGWSNDIEGARAMCRSIDLHPSMNFPKIFDRDKNVVVPQ